MPIVISTAGALIVGIAAGVAIDAVFLEEPQIQSDPWYAFVPDDAWRSTPEEALAVAASEQYNGADYWYLVANEDTDEVDYLLSPDGQNWEYCTEVLGWGGRWCAWRTDPNTLSLEPVATSGQLP